MEKEPITLDLETEGLNEEAAKNLEGLGTTPEVYGEYTYYRYTFPEFGPARYYQPSPRELILKLGDQNYLVIPDVGGEDEYPMGGTITFCPTSKPETPFSLEKTNCGIIAFGQPRFIQSPVLCGADGRSASHLMTLETGWGDCGNINILLLLDKDGKPSRAWMEASCC